MLLKGSCHCRAVRFSVDSATPQPYLRCYCRACRKTAGGGGFAVRVQARASTLLLSGGEHVRVYTAAGRELRRHFCGHCGSALWLANPRHPHAIYVVASAIDSHLPVPAERHHVMLDEAAEWLDVAPTHGDHFFPGPPDEDIEQWHQRVESSPRAVRWLPASHSARK